jgi:hypothetical protein
VACWAGVAAGSSTGVAACPNAASGLNTITVAITEPSKLRISFSLIAKAKPIGALSQPGPLSIFPTIGKQLVWMTV